MMNAIDHAILRGDSYVNKAMVSRSERDQLDWYMAAQLMYRRAGIEPIYVNRKISQLAERIGS